MAIDLLKDMGTPLDRQEFTWRELVQPPISKLDNDAFTRVRIILMNGIESEALRFGHACARMNRALQDASARERRIPSCARGQVGMARRLGQARRPRLCRARRLASHFSTSISAPRTRASRWPGSVRRPARRTPARAGW